MRRTTTLPVALLSALTLGGLVFALVSDDRWNLVAAACLAPGVVVALRTMVLSLKPPGIHP